MKLIVNPHKIELIQEEAVNEKEIDISKCEFEFDEEITEDYVKEAYFTLGDETYKQVITNNQCSFPQEVLVRPATIELGVVAYLVEDEAEIKRYNPTPVYFKTDLGSLKQAENSQPITPSEMEQYEQALQDGLEEVNSKLGDIDEAILETSNLNITATKTNNVTYVSLTDKEGTTNTVEILDGEPGTPGAPGQDGTTPTIGDNGNWYIGSTDTGKPSRGATGQTGQTGATGPAGRDGVDGISPTATVTKSGSTATITVTDKNGTTTTTVSDGTNGTNGRDGYVQYTAGDNITIENNVISASGGDLSNYYTKSETDAKINSIKGIHLLNPYNNYMMHTYFLDFFASGQVTWSSALMTPYLVAIMNDYIDNFNEDADYNMITVYVNDGIGNNRFVSRIENWSKTNKRPSYMSTYDTYLGYYMRSNISLTYTDGRCTSASASILNYPATNNYYPLLKGNTYEYTPTSDYNPATKKYVDNNKGQTIQYSTMPTASADTVGQVVQFTGATDTYTNGYFYIGVNNSGTYSWEQINVQPSSGGSSFVNAVHFVDVYSPSNTKVHLYRTRTYLDYDDITMGTAVCEAIKNAYNDARNYFETGFNIIRIESGEYTNTTIEYTINWNGNKPTGWQLAYVSLYSTKYFGRRMIQFLITWSGDDISAISNYTISSDTIKGLAVDNAVSYTPTSNYHPATKKYVDDAIATAITDALGGSY